MSGRPAGTGELLRDPPGEAEGVATGAADSKGSLSLSVVRATCLAAARRMALAASMSPGGGGLRDPLVAESAANMLRIEPGDGRIKLDSSRQERREELLRRVSVLGPRGGPRGCTTTTRGHSEY